MNDLTGRPQLLKQVNSSLILEVLAALGTATRVELAEKTGISQPTINAIVNELLEEGVIQDKGQASSNGGRRAQRFAIDPGHTCVLAVCVHGGRVEYELVNAVGETLGSGTESYTEGQQVGETLCGVLKRCEEKCTGLKAVGVGVPGAVRADGSVFAIPQVPQLEEKPLRDILGEAIKAAVIVENDMNAMALGYCSETLGQEAEDVVHIHIGKGIGAGVVLGGRILRGFSSFAGEISYMVTGSETLEGGSTRGPFETQYQNAKTMQAKADVVARLVTNVICMLNPPVLIFSGSDATEELVQAAKQACGRYVPRQALPSFRVMQDERRHYTRGLVRTAISAVGTDIKLVAGG